MNTNTRTAPTHNNPSAAHYCLKFLKKLEKIKKELIYLPRYNFQLILKPAPRSYGVGRGMVFVPPNSNHDYCRQFVNVWSHTGIGPPTVGQMSDKPTTRVPT